MNKLAFALVFMSAALVAESKPKAQVASNTVTLSCPKTASASGGGTYGGVSFNISCRKNRSTTVALTGLSGLDYSFRWGVETGSTGIDGASSGTGPATENLAGTGVVVTFQ
jgi:hypothetical protein